MELDFISVKVEEMKRAVEFYNRLFRQEPDHESERLVIYEFRGISFGLYDPTADGYDLEDTFYGNNTIPAFQVDDLDSEQERIQDFAEIDKRYDLEDHSGIVFRDTEGNVLEVYEWTESNDGVPGSRR